MTERAVRILDCTLRDGAYVMCFTAQDTYQIGTLLKSAGFDYIEVGQSMGLNSAAVGLCESLATDEELLYAAAQALEGVQWGTFLVPGIGDHRNLDMASACGIKFVRIGTNPTDIEQAEPYIAHAKRLGMTVSFNLMKSYALSPRELADWTALTVDYGADWIYLVDSAGGMLPDEVRTYMLELRERLTVPLGFHGHNNLGLAVANSLVAVECGAELIDTTLLGIGRDGGNAITEAMVAALMRRNWAGRLDLKQTIAASHALLSLLLSRDQRGFVDPLFTVTGYARMHSGFLKLLARKAKELQIDLCELIMAVGQIETVEVTEETIRIAAERLLRTES